jgi:hypothetical protein
VFPHIGVQASTAAANVNLVSPFGEVMANNLVPIDVAPVEKRVSQS